MRGSDQGRFWRHLDNYVGSETSENTNRKFLVLLEVGSHT